LRKGPFRRSSSELIRALRHVEEVHDLVIDKRLSHGVPPKCIQTLARLAIAKTNALQRQPEESRLATLVAFVLTMKRRR